MGIGLFDRNATDRVAGSDGDHGLVAAHEARAGVDDRFQEILPFAYLADARKVWADVAALIADGMAGQACGFAAVEHGLTPADVALFKRGKHLVEFLRLRGKTRDLAR